jgi:prepilin-type N-terminal cleavage/methylation domain-containing protein/prepilin-type processing-associated H-X9-DG protein
MRPAGNEKLGRAFTLVELLVVISVIALLMAILLPALGRARGVAKRTYCAANLRQIGIAMRSYLDDNRDIFPLACAYPWSITDPTNPGYLPPITQFLSRLLKSPKVFICPADTTADATPPYHLRTGNTSYWYRGYPDPPPNCSLINGLGGITIYQSCDVQQGMKANNIEVMGDFDKVHPGFTGAFRKRAGQKNFLFADWHIGNYKNQDQ